MSNSDRAERGEEGEEEEEVEQGAEEKEKDSEVERRISPLYMSPNLQNMKPELTDKDLINKRPVALQAASPT